MVYGLPISWPTINNVKNYHFYNILTIDKNLNVGNNLNIKFNLTSENLIIKNNGFFNSNINITNYILKIKDVLETNNINLINTHFVNKQNTNAKTVNIKLKNLATLFTIEKNINIEGNANMGLFSVGNNINCGANLNVKKKIVLKNNLNNNHNLNVENSNHKNSFTITNPLTLNNIHVLEDLNIKNNLNLKELTINDKLKIREDLITLNGVVLLPDSVILNQPGSLNFNSNTLNIKTNLNNIIYILNDSKGCDDFSSISINNNTHNIHITNNNLKSIDILTDDLDIFYNSNIEGNVTFTNNINVIDTIYINKNVNIKNDVILDKGYVKLPITDLIFPGAIRYNNNSNLIQTVKSSNKYQDLEFKDNNNTGINRDNNEVVFNIKNNNIITVNNNTFINKNTNIFNNVNIIDKLHIKNNIYTSSNINISNIPIQFYNGLLRTYNNNSKNYVSLTLEELNSFYMNPITSYNFYKINISTYYTNLLINNNIVPNELLFNNYNNYDSQIIHTNLYLSQIFINIIAKSELINTYYIQIIKNDTIIENIILENINSYNNFYKFNKFLYYNIQDKLKIKVKSLYLYDETSILVNLHGYKLIPINTKGTSNYITDHYIYFKNNTSFNVNIDFLNNINVLNKISHQNNINIHKISINTDKKKIFNSIINTDKLLDINNNFIITNSGNIGIGTLPDTNYLLNIYDNDIALEIYGNLNILDYNAYLNTTNILVNNINISNNINTKNIITNNLPLKDYSIKNNLNCLQNININKNINISNSLITDKLLVNKYNTNTYNYYVTSQNQNQNHLYLYENNNNLSYIFYNNNSNQHNKYLNHTNIKTIKNNNLDILTINNVLNIKHNNISFYDSNINHNTDNTYIMNINISNNKYFSINNTNTIINNDLIVDNININEKIKVLLYDIYGPKEPFLSYDFRNNNTIILYSYNNINKSYELYFSDDITNNLTYIYNNNIIYTILSTKPYYSNVGYNIMLDILYFTDIVLINNNIKTFYNNIKSFKVNNIYNYNVTIYYYNNNTIYPVVYMNKNSVINIYGLKTEIK